MGIEYRAEVIGSMLRPAYLKDARKRWEAGTLGTLDFKRIEDRAVDEMIALQERCGVDVVTDGEMRRTHFIAPLTDVISGVKPIPAFTRVWRRPHEKNQKAEQTDIQVQYAVVDRIHRLRSLTNEEFAYARGRATKPLKVTLPSPLMMTLRWSPEYSRDAYPDPFALFRDAADIVRDEARELAALGCEYIQIDAPELGMLCDPDRRREDFADRGMDPERLLTEGIDIINSVAEVSGVTFALHLCRGNNKGYYVGEGGYESIARQVFQRAPNFARFLLEYDDWRSGSFEPLREIPRDKSVVLGLISTKRVELESAAGVVERIDEASKYFPREKMALSTQCGFGTVWEGNPIPEIDAGSETAAGRRNRASRVAMKNRAAGENRDCGLKLSNNDDGGLPVTSRKQRIPFRDFSTLSAEDREMGERNKVNGEVVNIFRVLMQNPKLARSWSRFAGYILGGQSLPARDREILILRIGWLNQAPYEWEQHVRIGKAAGLTDDEIDRISKGPKAGWDKHEAALIQAADDLREKSVVSDETWKQLSERYSIEQMMDAVFTIGQYNLVSWALNSFGVPLDDYLPGAQKQNP